MSNSLWFSHQDVCVSVQTLSTEIWEFLSSDFRRRARNFQKAGKDPRSSQHFLKDSVRAEADAFAANLSDEMTRAMYQTAIKFWFHNYRPDFKNNETA